MKTSLLALAVVWLAAVGCTTSPPGPVWSYEGHTGPSHWGDLSPEYVLAQTGRSQSPIDNGRSVQVDAPAGSALVVGQARYELKQFHFHSPSEHTVDGAWFVLQAPAEASASQVRALRDVISGNNRPAQPLHGRAVVVVP